MKIESIKTYHLRSYLQKPFGFSQWTYDQRNVLIVEVKTDSGLSGWGECYGPAELIQTAIEKFYAPKILGLNPLHNEVVWYSMWSASLDFARSGIMMAAMSGIDMALWDAKGKAFNVSCSTLMGGASQATVPCYATGMYYRASNEETSVSELVEEAKGYAEQGFLAMKIKVGKNRNFDEKFVVSMREALPEIILAADSNHAYDLPEATRMAHLLESLDYAWFEEPLSPEHPELFAQLQAKTSIPLAAGECEQTKYGFHRLIESCGVQLIQPDLAYCGGITEGLKIRSVASAKGINTIPHVWGTQLNLAAATHFLTSGYVEPGRAEKQHLYLEYDRTENQLRDNIYTTSVHVSNGYAHVPQGPGLGVELDMDLMQEFLVSSTET